MRTFYSAATNSFYDTRLFGEPTLTIIDPDFEWPMIEVPDPNHKGEGEGEGEAPLVQVRDETIEPPIITVSNPDCRLPEDAIEISAEQHQALINHDGTQQLAADEHGRPILVDHPPMPLETLAELKRQELDQARDAAFAKGLEYDFNGEIDVVQTRPQDQINLLGLSAKAQRLIAAGQPEATLTFRSGDNVNRELNAAEIDRLTLAALGHIETIYQKSWTLKDGLERALLEGDREEIEQLIW
ncbi:site-specific DNA-methyltransferase [Bacillus phage vB_BpuM-ZY1]|nr:site-specific DNA-methyltransferase [Bacillus phage vB_BpuM-ZY1]